MRGFGNIIRTTGLFGFMFILFIAIGWLIGGFFLGNWIAGTLFFLAIAALMNIIAYFYSHKLILRSHKAKIIEEQDNPRLFNIVKEVAREADIKMPKVAIVPSDTPNAFATGRNEDNAVVAATEGILNVLSDEELKGVIAHEVGHIKGRDMLIMSIAATLAGAITFMARMVWFQMFFSRRRIHPVLLVALILAPIGAIIIKLAISRKREYEADKKGAEISKNPNALADALEKLNSENKKNPMKSKSTSSASLFIVNPFKKSGFVKLFSTHPPMEERVERLRKMASEFSYL
ncbi:MAG: zinc metalloprotease HtpX [Candidatus Natronoplasma sp.]